MLVSTGAGCRVPFPFSHLHREVSEVTGKRTLLVLRILCSLTTGFLQHLSRLFTKPLKTV